MQLRTAGKWKVLSPRLLGSIGSIVSKTDKSGEIILVSEEGESCIGGAITATLLEIESENVYFLIGEAVRTVKLA